MQSPNKEMWARRRAKVRELCTLYRSFEMSTESLFDWQKEALSERDQSRGKDGWWLRDIEVEVINYLISERVVVEERTGELSVRKIGSR